jgi:hypothetical protein
MKLFTNSVVGQSVRETPMWHIGLIYVIAAIVMAILTIFLFGSAMRGFDHDENIYCAAGALIASGKVMYKDFAYLQMPLLPVLYASIFTFFKTTNYLFVGRVFSVTCSAITMFLVLLVFLHAFRQERIYGIIMGTSAAVLYASNPVIQLAGGFAWNHSLPILCMALSCLIVASSDFSRPVKTRRFFLAGVFTGVAVFTRLSFIFGCLVIFLVLAFLPDPVSRGVRFKKLLLPFCAGTTVASAVVFYYFFKAPDSFIFDTIQYFLITGAQHWTSGWGAAISLKEKLIVGVRTLKGHSYLLSLILFFFSCFLAMSTYKYRFWKNVPFILSSLLAAAMFIAAFVITPVWDQYFAAPVPFILIAIAYAVSGSISAVNRESGRKMILCLIAGLFILSAAMSILYNKNALENIKFAFSKKDWTPTKVYIISRKIAEIMGPDKLVLTLAPVYVLEGGGKIYPQLSTGPFLYRYSRFLSDDQRRIAVSTGPRSLSTLLQKRPPDAVLTGFENIFLERPFIDYAERSGWQRSEIGRFVLYMPG